MKEAAAGTTNNKTRPTTRDEMRLRSVTVFRGGEEGEKKEEGVAPKVTNSNG